MWVAIKDVSAWTSTTPTTDLLPAPGHVDTL